MIDRKALISFVFIMLAFAILSFVVGMNFLLAGQGVINVDAGADRNAQSGGSVRLLPTVSHSEGDPLIYSWNCNNGTLSSATVLSPNLTLPTVTVNTPITCTLTASTAEGDSANDSVIITVIGGTDDNQNHNPVADAGQNKIVFSGKTVTLLGDATDQDGDPLTYAWSCDSGSLSNSTILNPVFTAPTISSETTVNCNLVVTDSKGATNNDYVYITITTTAQNNGNPVVDAGADKNLSASGSVKLTPTVTDPDGDPLTYSWTCSQGSLSSNNILNPTFNAYNLSDGSMAVCTLNAYDNKGGNSSDSLNIYIGNQSSQNRNPVVDAGSSLYLQSGGSVKLNPTVSDPDGDILTYNWSCTGGKLSSYNILNPTFTLTNYSGTYNSYYCTINVSDGRGGTASGSITISTDQQYSQNPVITAGGNREVVEGNSISLNVTAYDPNGYSLNYGWTCTGGVLSSYSVLNPTYTAPMVNSDTNYYCTITASNNRGGSSTANVNILVRDSGNNTTSASITTNQATSITTTSANLNGRLQTGNSVNTSFDWGRINSGMTNSANGGNKNGGDIFSASLNDLEKGKAYQFKAKGQGNSGTVYGSTLKFITKPEAPSYFNASLSGNTRILLTWTKGEGAYYTTITRKIGSYPQTATDGSVVYYGVGTTFTDSVSSGQYYYYRAWSVAYDGGLYAWSDSDYARDYVMTANVVTTTPVVRTVVRNVPVVKTVVEEEPEEEPECVFIQEDAMSVKVLGKNLTQNKEWSRNINANPGDQIDIEVDIKSLSEKSLDNVVLTNVLPVKVAEVSNISIDGDSVGVNMYDGIILGKIKPNETKTMTFTIKLADAKEFTQSETSLVNSVEVGGKDFEPVKDKLMIKVGSGSSFGFASAFSLFGGNWFWGFLLFGLFLFILLLILLLVYLFLMLRRKDQQEKERLDRENYAAQRSKYFQIQ
ncbi:MAG: PKD domain-containing protein [Candidatus Pacebacteria bacterium]|nr:PKD domain-containing protein [Candidatus Paceibacterota bacterium]